MLKRIAVISAAAALVGTCALAAVAAGQGSQSSTPDTVVAVLGPRVNVAPGRFVRAYARCPSGYYVTGGGAYSGAITEIISSPMTNLRGWFIDGTNTTPAKRTFQERADAVCVLGTAGEKVGTATAVRGLSRQAQADFLRADRR